MRHQLLVVLGPALVLTACGGETRRDHAPTLALLEPSAPALTEGESVRLSAVLTDTDGVVDLAGARLVGLDGTVYGEFVAEGSDGVYVLELSWEAVHEAEAIEFAGQEARELVATFIDASGHEVTQTVTLTLRCDDGAACGGACVDTGTDPAHCGGCRQACDDGLACEESACAASVRALRGEAAGGVVDEVVAIRESLLDGTPEVAAEVKGGRFVLADLDTDVRYLVDFRSQGVSQGWLAFPAGAETARVIPPGRLDIDLGRCTVDGTALEYVCDGNPLGFTDDDGDGTVDLDDDYLPVPVEGTFEGAYSGTQLWNGLEYGLSFVRHPRSHLEWTVYIYSPGAPGCDYSLSGYAEQFRGGLAGLFSVQGWLSDTCQVRDQNHYLLVGDPAGTLSGEAIHWMVRQSEACPQQGCLGSPPHGGGFEARRAGPALCE